MNNRQLFFQHIAQTSPAPIGLEMVSAAGIYQYDTAGKAYVDLIAGFSVCNIGHSHPKVIAAIKEQVEKYMHLIVYGEFIQSPQVQYAALLASVLPHSLNSVYFTNSGAEATEGAMKLAKRVTNRSKIICFNNSYHGSTQGALSLMGSEYWRNAYRPLLPNVYHYNYNDFSVLDAIDKHTACVILETVQAESGVTIPTTEWLHAIRDKCNATCSLLILDEIQVGFGRTGTLWAFEQFGIVPDILLLGKALGGGLPLGAFIAHESLMKTLTYNPVLGHITTFGGNPVSCAAGKAALEVLLENKWIESVKEKEGIFLQQLQGLPVRMAGLIGSIFCENFETNKAIIHSCIQNGIITDWFLFAEDRLRISAPLCITEAEIIAVCNVIKRCYRQFIP